MVDRRLISVLLVILGAGLLACSSTPETEDEVAQHAEQPDASIDVLEAYRGAAGWLPQESSVVISGTSPAAWYFLDELALPTANPDAEPGAPGTLEGLQTDLERLFIDHIGFDPSVAEAAVIAIHFDDITAVLLGDFGDIQGRTEVDINGHTAYKFSLGGDEFNDIDEFQHIYALPIDDPRPGLVMTMNIEQMERIENARHTEDGGMTLASGERAGLFERLFSEAPNSQLSVASPIGEFSPFIGEIADFPMPDAAVFNYGDSAGLTLEGDDENLDIIDEQVDEWVSELQATLQEHYDERDGELFEELTAIYGYHGLESIAGQLQPERDEGRMRYQVELTEMNWGSFSVMSMFIMLSLWDAMEPLQQFAPPMYDFGPPQAQTTVRELARVAAGEFEAEQRYCDIDADCTHPWHADATRDGQPVADDEKVFAGGTDIRMVTMERAPVEGQPEVPRPLFGDEVDVDFEPKVIVERLDLDVETETDTRYIYETGPGTGSEATATITAETIVDPMVDRRRRVTQRLEVDARGEVVFADPIVDDEFVPVDVDQKK